MLAKLRRKPVLIVILSFIIVALVAGFAIPAIAAGSPPFGPRNGGNKNVTVVQGTIASGGLTPTTITINKGGNASTQVTLTLNSSTNFNIHGTGWFSYSSLANGTTPVTAAYNSNQTAPPLTGPVASQVTINMPVPAPGTGNPPANVNLARVQGTIALGTPGAITITFAEPSNALTLGANNAVIILYNTSSPYAIQGLMLAGPGTTTTPSRPTPTLPKNLATVQGTIQLGTPGTITITFAEPSNALTLGANNAVTILYNTSSPYAIQGLMSAGPGTTTTPARPTPTLPKNLAAVQGTIALGTPGTITITFAEPSNALTLGANNAVTILYNTSSPYAIQGLMLPSSGPATTPARPTPTLPKNLAAVQGTIQLGTPGTITITFTEPSTALTLGANKAVTILYNNSSPYAIQGLMSAGPGGNFGGQPGGFFNAPGGNQPAPRFGRNGTTS